jgi:hypothetical protein
MNEQKRTGYIVQGDDQPSLFDDSKSWETEWLDMPEFVQEKQKCFAEIIVRFETEDDLKKFSELVGQKLTAKTRSIWHPFKSHWHGIRKEWGDDEP